MNDIASMNLQGVVEKFPIAGEKWFSVLKALQARVNRRNRSKRTFFPATSALPNVNRYLRAKAELAASNGGKPILATLFSVYLDRLSEQTIHYRTIGMADSRLDFKIHRLIARAPSLHRPDHHFHRLYECGRVIACD